MSRYRIFFYKLAKFQFFGEINGDKTCRFRLLDTYLPVVYSAKKQNIAKHYLLTYSIIGFVRVL